MNSKKIKQYTPQKTHRYLKAIRNTVKTIVLGLMYLYKKLGGNKIKLLKNRGKGERYLEIGPGNKRIPGFETLNIVAGSEVDYVYDAAKKLPFQRSTFDVIYNSHVLEHIPWHKTEDVLKEWCRILKPGGTLEIWVPDAMFVFQELEKAEAGESDSIPDDWDVLNPNKNRYLWVNGRLLYGARNDYPSWHKALFTEGYLKDLLSKVGFTGIKKMNKKELRTQDHGMIDLGVKGTKK
jgi:SAM-dependent methyltransferase